MMVAKNLEYLTLSIIAALAVLFIVATGKTALAQVSVPPGPGPGHEVGLHSTGGEVTSGRLMFRQYCAPCHGMDAKGDGPVADTLKKKPADLTLLSKNNGGKFPYDEVYNMISGKEVIASHGTREMPIWGLVFAQRNMPGAAGRTPAQVKHRIDTIIAYIESVQVQ
jgi:mono/diheme cytochrome c family protein